MYCKAEEISLAFPRRDTFILRARFGETETTVLRDHARAEHDPSKLLERLADFLVVLESHSIVGALWIVEPRRVRIPLRTDEE